VSPSVVDWALVPAQVGPRPPCPPSSRSRSTTRVPRVGSTCSWLCAARAVGAEHRGVVSETLRAARDGEGFLGCPGGLRSAPDGAQTLPHAPKPSWDDLQDEAAVYCAVRCTPARPSSGEKPRWTSPLWARPSCTAGTPAASTTGSSSLTSYPGQLGLDDAGASLTGPRTPCLLLSSGLPPGVGAVSSHRRRGGLQLIGLGASRVPLGGDAVRDARSS